MNYVKIFVLFAMMIVATSFVSAQNLDILYVDINGHEMSTANIGNFTDNLLVHRGEELEIEVRVQAIADAKNLQAEADIYGYKYGSQEEQMVSDVSNTFDLDEGDIDTIDLTIDVPKNIDMDYFLLRIRVADQNSPTLEYDYQLHVGGIAKEDAVTVDDFSFNPSSIINAGRAFTAMVRVENLGDDTIDDVTVKVAIPDLNIQDTENIEELDVDEKETLEEFLLRIPDCAEPGVYDVEITVEFDEYYSTQETSQITVLEGDTCVLGGTNEEQIVVTVPQTLEVEAGSQANIPIMIANEGSSAETFVISVTGVESWGTSQLSSPVAIVSGEDVETVFLTVMPDEDATGEKVFTVTITSDEDTETVPLTVNIVGGKTSTSGTSLKTGLEVALVVLVIILIIIGLIIGFNKLRGQEEEGTQTYY